MKQPRHTAGDESPAFFKKSSSLNPPFCNSFPLPRVPHVTTLRSPLPPLVMYDASCDVCSDCFNQIGQSVWSVKAGYRPGRLCLLQGFHVFSVPSAANVASKLRWGWCVRPMGSFSATCTARRGDTAPSTPVKSYGTDMHWRGALATHPPPPTHLHQVLQFAGSG